jgi:hypothetical protein
MYVNYFRMAWRTTTEMFRAGSGETLLQGVQAFSKGPLFSDLNYLSDSIRLNDIQWSERRERVQRSYESA